MWGALAAAPPARHRREAAWRCVWHLPRFPRGPHAARLAAARVATWLGLGFGFGLGLGLGSGLGCVPTPLPLPALGRAGGAAEVERGSELDR